MSWVRPDREILPRPFTYTHARAHTHTPANDQLYDVAVNTRTVLASVPPQGCEAILVEILQSKRSAGGPHFTCCFLTSE